MARVHGKNVNFSFNGVALEPYISNTTMTFTVEEAESTAYADANQVFLAGKKDVKTEISGSFDAGTNLVDQTLFEGFGAGPKSTVFDPTGSGPGANDPEYKCTSSGLTGVLVDQYQIDLPAGEKASFQATLQHSGATTRATS